MPWCRLTVRYDPPSWTSPARPTPLPPGDRAPLPPGPARPLTFATTCWGGETMPEAAGPADPVLPDATAAQLEAEIAHHVWLALLMARAGQDGPAAGGGGGAGGPRGAGRAPRAAVPPRPAGHGANGP